MEERLPQLDTDRIDHSIFVSISSNVNGGCFSVSGRSILEVVDCMFFGCETSKMGGCIYAELSELFVSKMNCFWCCVGGIETHAFQCNCPKSTVDLNTIQLCAPSQVGAFGSYYILNSNVLVSSTNCTSCCIFDHGPSGFFTKSHVEIMNQITVGCIGKAVFIVSKGNSLVVDRINYVNNTQTRNCHFRQEVSETTLISNGVFVGNSRNSFFCAPQPFLSNCVFDVEFQVPNTDCQFGVVAPRTLPLKGKRCGRITRVFSRLTQHPIRPLLLFCHFCL